MVGVTYKHTLLGILTYYCYIFNSTRNIHIYTKIVNPTCICLLQFPHHSTLFGLEPGLPRALQGPIAVHGLDSETWSLFTSNSPLLTLCNSSSSLLMLKTCCVCFLESFCNLLCQLCLFVLLGESPLSPLPHSL